MKKLLLLLALLLPLAASAQLKISDLTGLGAAPATGDKLIILDVSDTTQSANGSTKSLTIANLFTSPTFTTPTLGVATATSLNGLTITTSTGTVTLANGKTFSVSNTLTLAGTDGSTLNIGTGGTLGTAAYTAATAYEVPLTFSTGLTRTTNTITVNAINLAASGSGGVTGTLPVANGGTGITAFGTGVATALGVNVGSAGAFVTFNGALGTPSSGTLTNATGLPIATGVSGLGTGVATFLATPSSANLAAAVTNETGTNLLVFSDDAVLSEPRVDALRSSGGDQPVVLTLDSGAGTIVNSWTIVPSATGTAVSLQAVGTDTNIDMDLVPKGSGGVRIKGSPLGDVIYTNASAYQAADSDLTTWAGITPGANVGTFLATPSGANLAAALTSPLPLTDGGTGYSSSPKFRARMPDGTQTIATSTWTKIDFSTEEVDTADSTNVTTANKYNTTNKRWTPAVEGWYSVTISVRVFPASATWDVALYKNGSVERSVAGVSSNPGQDWITGTYLVYLDSDDYVEGYVWQNSGSDQSIYGTSQYSYFLGHLVP